MTSRLAFVLMLVVGCPSPAKPVATTRPEPKSPVAETATRAALPLASAPDPASKPKRAGAYANVDPTDDFVEGPPDLIEDCEGKLAAAGVTFRAATLASFKKGKIQCGAPQVVTYVKGPGGVAYNSSPLLTCGMALALAQFEKVAQEESKTVFGMPISKIEHLGTFSCRDMQNYPGFTSEHSYANALDLGAFILKDGRRIEVLRDFDKGDAVPAKPAGLFLRSVSRRAHDEDVFSHVLTPFWDRLHANHFHFDLARYRNDGTRPRG